MEKLKELPDLLVEEARDKWQAFGHRAQEIGHRINLDLETLRVHGKIHIQNHRLRSTPDWIRRSIRLSCCLILFGLLGHAIKWSNDAKVQTEIMQSCNWAAITCIVVTAPLIGKVSEVSTLRVIGTILGGLYGFCTFEFGLHVISAYGSSLFVSLMAPTIIVSTTYLAYKKGLEQLAKFMQLTYVIVGYGASGDKGDLDAFLRACMRIAGIIAGGVVSLIFAVIILPRSANVETCRELKKALKLLIDLNHEVWKHTSNPVPRVEGTTNTYAKKGRTRITDRLAEAPNLGHSSVSFVTNLNSQSHMHLLGGQALPQDSSKVQQSERIVANLYNILHKVEEMMDQCKGEVYVHHLWGLYFFVPGIHFFQLGKWHLPANDIKLLVLTIRRLMRLLWTLLLDFEEGFDENMMVVLDRYYPKALMSELSLYLHRSLVDLHAVFPSQTAISVDNLLSFGQLVDCLIQISDTHSRNAALTVRQQKDRMRARRRAQAGVAPSNSIDILAAELAAATEASAGAGAGQGEGAPGLGMPQGSGGLRSQASGKGAAAAADELGSARSGSGAAALRISQEMAMRQSASGSVYAAATAAATAAAAAASTDVNDASVGRMTVQASGDFMRSSHDRSRRGASGSPTTQAAAVAAAAAPFNGPSGLSGLSFASTVSTSAPPDSDPPSFVHITSGGGAGSGSGTVPASLQGGGGAPVFLTHAASGMPGEMALLDLPPRRFMRMRSFARRVAAAEDQLRASLDQGSDLAMQPGAGGQAAPEAGAEQGVALAQLGTRRSGEGAAAAAAGPPGVQPRGSLGPQAGYTGASMGRLDATTDVSASPFASLAPVPLATPAVRVPERRLATIISEADLVAVEEAAQSHAAAFAGIARDPQQAPRSPEKGSGGTHSPAHPQGASPRSGVLASGLGTSRGGSSGAAGGATDSTLADGAAAAAANLGAGGGSSGGGGGSAAQQVLDASVLGSQQYQDWTQQAQASMPEGPELSRGNSDSLEVLARSFGNAAEVRSMLVHALGGIRASLPGDASQGSAAAGASSGAPGGGVGSGGGATSGLPSSRDPTPGASSGATGFASPGAMPMPMPLGILSDGTSPSDMSNVVSRARAMDHMLANLTLDGLGVPIPTALSRAMSSDRASLDLHAPAPGLAAAHVPAAASASSGDVLAATVEGVLAGVAGGLHSVGAHDLDPALASYVTVSGGMGPGLGLALGLDPQTVQDALLSEHAVLTTATAAAVHSGGARDLLFEGLLAGAAMPDPCMPVGGAMRTSAEAVSDGPSRSSVDMPRHATTATAPATAASGEAAAASPTHDGSSGPSPTGLQAVSAGAVPVSASMAGTATEAATGAGAGAATGILVHQAMLTADLRPQTNGDDSSQHLTIAITALQASVESCKAGNGELQLHDQPWRPEVEAIAAEGTGVDEAADGEHLPLLQHGYTSLEQDVNYHSMSLSRWHNADSSRRRSGSFGGMSLTSSQQQRPTAPDSVVIDVLPSQLLANGHSDAEDSRHGLTELGYAGGSSASMASSFGGAATRAMRTSGSRSTLGDAPAAVRSSFARRLDRVGSGEEAETARLLHSTRDTSSGGGPPVWASPFSAFMRISEAAGAAMGVGGSNLSDRDSEHGVQAPAGGGGSLRPGGSLLDALPKLQAATVPSAELRGPALANGLSASLVEPISFPPTSEGYVSQVRWYSFQFVMDEIVEELEEAYMAVSAVLSSLPHPIL